MKQIIATLLFVMFFFTHTAAQWPDKKAEINYSDPFQIDSSAYFIIPEIVDADDLKIYGKGKGILPWGNYRQLFFYNSATNQVKKLFNGQLALIVPFYSKRNYYDNGREKEQEIPANILPHHIIYEARTEDFNGDKALDSDDPVYLYVSSKTGDQLRQITPQGLQVVSWSSSKDKKMLLVKMQKHTNRSKKFGNGEDQLYYRVDLDEDISKIKCYQINLQ
jgi:hypothetical protein